MTFCIHQNFTHSFDKNFAHFFLFFFFFFFFVSFFSLQKSWKFTEVFNETVEVGVVVNFSYLVSIFKSRHFCFHLKESVHQFFFFHSKVSPTCEKSKFVIRSKIIKIPNQNTHKTLMNVRRTKPYLVAQRDYFRIIHRKMLWWMQNWWWLSMCTQTIEKKNRFICLFFFLFLVAKNHRNAYTHVINVECNLSLACDRLASIVFIL